MPDISYDKVFDISPEFDQPVFTGEDGYRKNREYLLMLKGDSIDILLREFTLSDGRKGTVMLVDGMCNKDLVERSVILAARRFVTSSPDNKFMPQDGTLQQFASSEVSAQKSLSKGYIAALSGDAFLIIEGEEQGYVFGYRWITSRSVDESPNEGSVRGPHEAFTENIRINTALLRRRITDPNFVIELKTVGARSHTAIAICYIRGLTQPRLIQQVKERIEGISIDLINDSGELEQILEDSPDSLFPQIDGSEMPDVIAAELCNGRVAVLVNGSPQALLIPATLSSLMKVNEDNYQRWSFATFI
ncbi:MAG: spore germination protein, partial [Clostridia bacterium]|nr:spore germination protein [Clostridia bacterium]